MPKEPVPVRGPLQVSEGDFVPMELVPVPVEVPGPVPGPVPVEIGETFPEPIEVSSPDGAESDEEPQIAPPTLEGTTVVTRRRDKELMLACLKDSLKQDH